MKYRVSKAASIDLESIWLYTCVTWSEEQADRYFNLLMNEIEYLAVNPESGKSYSHIINGYFRSRVKSHFIFYKINRKRGEVEIIRILHQKMDLESQLND